jgi:hypothetical protein
MATLYLVLDLCLVFDFLFNRSELCESCLATLHYWEVLKWGYIDPAGGIILEFIMVHVLFYNVIMLTVTLPLRVEIGSRN